MQKAPGGAVRFRIERGSVGVRVVSKPGHCKRFNPWGFFRRAGYAAALRGSHGVLTSGEPAHFAFDQKRILTAMAAAMAIWGMTAGLSGCGSVQPGTLTLSAQAVDFGSVTLGKTAGATITVSNTGSTVLEITQLQLSGSDFSVAGQKNLPIEVPGGGSYSLSLSFKPKATGAATGEVTLTSNATTNDQLTITLSGTGTQTRVTPNLTPSTNSLDFGDVTVGTSAKRKVTLTSSGTAVLTITSGTVTGKGFSLSGVSFPLTLDPGLKATLTVAFDPATAGVASGSVALTTNTSAGSASISLSGTGEAPVVPLPGVSALTCSSKAMTSVGTDACTVTLTAAAGTGGTAVNLSSNSTTLSVPASVTVAEGSASAGFTATVNSIAVAQTVVLTATAGGTTKSVSIALGTAAPGLTLDSTQVGFGDVPLTTSATQTVTLTSSGTAPLTINTGVVTGTGFSLAGISFPLTLNPGQTANMAVVFDPTALGAAAGSVTLNSNAPGGAATVMLTGTGAPGATYNVDLSWTEPTGSTDSVAGYNVYRSEAGTAAYQLLNSSPNVATSYTDAAVDDGKTYTYYVVSVDASGNESAPSQVYTAVIP